MWYTTHVSYLSTLVDRARSWLEGASPAPTPVTLAARRRPDTFEVPDVPVTTWSDWDVDAVRAADGDLVVGNFSRAAILCESMQADDRVQSALNGRIKGVTKCHVKMQPSLRGGSASKRARVARELEELFPVIAPVETIEQMLAWTILIGFSIAELIWELHGGKWIPRLKVWHPLYIYYRIDIRRYIVITMEGPLEIEPNDPKWFLYTPFGAYRGWMRGAVRSVAIPWLVRQYALRDWSRYSEKHGLPTIVTKYPAAALSEDKARFASRIRSLGSETSLSLPQPLDGPGWDVALLEASDGSWQGFQGLIGQCDTSITLAIRGTNLTTEVKGGSLAAAGAHRDEDSDYAQADALKFGQALQLQVYAPMCMYNEGDANLAPFPLLEATPEEDKSQKAATIVQVAGAMAQLETQPTPWAIDREAMALEYGLPLINGGSESATPTPIADSPEDLPGAQGESGGNVPDPTVATRLAGRSIATGQDYLDAVVSDGLQAARVAMKSQLRDIHEMIATSGSFETLKRKLEKAAKGAKHSHLREPVKNAIVLSELVGRASLVKPALA